MDNTPSSIDVVSQKTPLIWVTAAAVVIFFAAILASVSIGKQELLTIDPKPAVNPIPGLLTFGYTQTCIDGGYRITAFFLHLIGIILGFLMLFGVVILLGIWWNEGSDRMAYRITRIVFGSITMLAGFCMLIALLFFHLHELEEKWATTALRPYNFNNWSKDQQVMSIFQFGVSYILLWLAVALAFIAAWILLGSSCCWTLDDEMILDQEPISLPRVRPFQGTV